MAMRDRVDAIVAGAGPAGLCAALALAAHGCRTLVVDLEPAGARRVGEHLSPKTIASLSAIGLGHVLHDERHRRSAGIAAHWGGLVHRTDYLFTPFGAGRNLDRQAFDAALATTAQAAGVEIRRPARILRVDAGAAAWHVEIAEGGKAATCTSRFLIDATGRASWLARRLGVERERSDRLVGVVAYARQAATVASTLVIESLRTGWAYLAPLRDRRAAVCLLTDADLIPRAPGALRAWWNDTRPFAAHTLLAIDPLDRHTPLVVRSASSGRLRRVCGPGWLAVGDAATSEDPLSSRGLSKAFSEGHRAAESVVAALSGPSSWMRAYDEPILAQFETYLSDRRRYYREERRWSASAFWQRRHALSALN
jgi:flavin-dependent dehydrogenase